MLTTRPPKFLYNYSLETGLHVKAILGTWRKIVTHSQTTVLHGRQSDYPDRMAVVAGPKEISVRPKIFVNIITREISCR
jgi:hypothetical protein